ncbi:carbohydrate binding family 9 domain-containing protein [bacterium]|nr:carbohydrate binding family 9 domain-containing protein [bacterium]
MASKTLSKRRFHSLIVAIFALLTIPLWAGVGHSESEQSPLSPVEGGGMKEIRAVRTSSEIDIDGFLDEPAWQRGETTTSFLQSKPNYGAQPSESTVVIVLYDAENLYLGIRCYDSQPGRIEANMTQRDDELWNDDAIEIFIDSFHDHQSCTFFLTNPLGTQTDGRCTGNGATAETIWDGDWHVKTRITSWGWCAELAIPFFNLPFDARKEQIWGINFMRMHRRTGQDHLWQLAKHFFRVSDYGHLVGLRDLKKGRALEVMPFTSLRRSQNPDEKLTGDAGLDLKYNLTSTFCANLTLNPDFAQIEADPDQINLSTEELRLPEKRPFFLEGCELFGTATTLFYSRRIGEITAGGKLTGKVHRFNLAIVDAQTPGEEGDPESFRDQEANFLAARLKGNILGSSFLGLTGVNWANGTGYSRAAGLDAGLTLPLGFILNTQASLSVEKDEILNLEKTQGWEKRVDLSHNSQHFEGYLTYVDRDPDFHLNTGYFGGRNDVRGFHGVITYMRPTPSLHLHDAHFNSFFGSYEEKDSGKLNFQYFRENISIFYKFLGCWFANGFDGQWSRERVADETYDNWQAYVSLIYNYASFENAGLRIKRGRTFGATTDIMEAWLRCKLFGRLSLDLFTNKVAFAGHQNQIGWPDQWVSILKTRLDVTQDIYLRTFLQTNDTSGWDLLKDINLLLAWELTRRNTLYLAFNHDEGWDDLNHQRETTQRALMKISLFMGI